MIISYKGSNYEFEEGMNSLDILGQIDPDARKSALAVKLDGEVTELAAAVKGSCELVPLFGSDPEGLRILRHSASHVLAQAAQCVWKDVYKVRVPKPGGRYEEIGMPNPWLDGINRAAFLLGTKLHTKVSDRYIDPNKCDGVPPAVQALCRRIYGWLKVTDNKTEQ